MVGKDFMFNDIWLSDFGYKMYAPSETPMFISMQIDKSEITPVKQTPNHYSSYYSDVLILQFFIMKDFCDYEEQNKLRLSNSDIDEMRSWLQGAKIPTELFVESLDANDTDVFYYGVFNDIQPYLLDHECYGLNLIFTCNAPYGFTKQKIKFDSFTSSSTTKQFDLNCVQQNGFLSPVITIDYKSKSSTGTYNTISITNDSIDASRDLTITTPIKTQGAKIVIDCSKQMITDDESGYALKLADLGFNINEFIVGDFMSSMTYTINWIRLLYGKNTITIDKGANLDINSIEFSVKIPFKAGEC